VSENEMAMILTSLNKNVKREQVAHIFSMADINGDGQITFDEFYNLFKQSIKDLDKLEVRAQATELNWMQKLVMEMESSIRENKMSLLDVFQIIDEDKSGYIDIEEFNKLLSNMGVKVNLQDTELMFKQIDLKNTGMISYD
jgi:Ca2+-binding EF-hand superfamily protein